MSNKLKGIYLGACRAYHENYNIDYNDIVGGYHINIISDMMKVDLNKYDYIIATPPCNYYSRANYRRETSIYAQETKHLLPDIIKKCSKLNKPFIIENVRNWKKFEECGIIEYCNKNGIIIYEYGRHTYFSNLLLNFTNIPQKKDNIQYINNTKTNYRQGGENVHQIIEYFLKYIHE